MKRLDTGTFGPWAIITGASSGIGEEFARQVAASGLHLVLAARRLRALEALGSELARTFGIQYRTVGLDLTTDDVLDTLSEATRDLDIGLVISNAGAMAPGDFLLMDHQALRRDLRLNVQAHLDLSYHFGQRLAQRGRGGLLLVASTVGLQGVPFAAEYAAAKAYVLTLGEALHVEFQRVGVHVTVLSPGATDTPMIAASGFDPTQMPMKPMAT
ncbi:MAG TPA: SDR family NAD(P)-dependent oxidoreductase, partial [Ktedonobacteraceae bacterium]|nr:SDR family NAD(P)-dependent oxidoreductase [Ktedonobacteraceae bacterium]